MERSVDRLRVHRLRDIHAGGLWSRLCNYIASGHAGNKLLLRAAGKQGLDYLRDNFTYALLEYWPMRVETSMFLSERHTGSTCSAPRLHGYNANERRYRDRTLRVPRVQERASR